MGVVLTVLAGCMPAPVSTVDSWLRAYAEGDVDRMVALTDAPDRKLVAEGLAALDTAPTSTLALAMPPRPLKHEIADIVRKDPDGKRQVLEVVMTLKNPLPYASEKVGNPLAKDFPRTRPLRRRFASVQQADGKQWGVKLDLERVLARARFVRRFDHRLRRRAFEEAKAMLEAIPPPPDDGNAQPKKDRLRDTLQAELKKAEERVNKRKTAKTTTSTPAAAAPRTP